MDKSQETESFEKRYYHEVRARFLGGVALHEVRKLDNYEKRREDELISGLSEALAGRVQTHYQFELDDRGNLVAQDEEPTRFMLNRALANMRLIATKDSFYNFAVERTQTELCELDEQEAMAKGVTNYDTLITFSPYNEELDVDEQSRRKLVAAGQMPVWGRAMVRISHWDGHKMHIITRSIDNSSVDLLRQAARSSHALGYSFKASSANQMLGERIPIEASMDLEAALCLADNITQTADKILERDNPGEQFEQGRRASSSVDNFAYIKGERQMIKHLIETGHKLAREHDQFSGWKKAFDAQVYNYAALLEARMVVGKHEPIVNPTAAAAAAGASAAAAGIEYNMCGYVLTGPDGTGAASKTGFESLMRLEGKKIKCPECKTRVVVPKEELAAGRLLCQHCGHGVDVCTGQQFSKNVKNETVETNGTDVVALINKALGLEKQVRT